MHSDLIKCFFSKSGEINEKVELWHRICDGFPVKICLSLQKDRLYYYFLFPSRILKGIKTIYYTKKTHLILPGLSLLVSFVLFFQES